MWHQNRTWSIAEEPDAAELAYKLSQRTWTLCQGFRHGGYLYLNDATHEDGAGEFGVVRAADLAQVESITFSWCTADRALEYIRRITTGAFADQRLATVRPDQLQTPEEHRRCSFCR